MQSSFGFHLAPVAMIGSVPYYLVIKRCIFSSPERNPGRAIVLPPASASVLAAAVLFNV